MKCTTLMLPLATMALVSACADPVVVPPAGPAEAALACDQLALQIQDTYMAERDARADDRAKASYLLIVPAYVSWYRMDQAEGAAQARRAQLQKMYSEKNCPPMTAAAAPATTPAP